MKKKKNISKKQRKKDPFQTKKKVEPEKGASTINSSSSLSARDRTESILKGFESVQISPRSSLILILIFGLLVSLAVQFSHMRYWSQHRNSYYYDQSLPLMSTLDAYYYLNLTSDFLKGQYHTTEEKRSSSFRPDSVPLLVFLTAALHKLTHAPLERIAFYLPPLLASLMALIYVFWGTALKSPSTAFFASLAGASSFYWYTRTALGRYDTDCLNPFFALLIVFMVYLFCSAPGPKRYLYLIAAFLLAYAFARWWPQAKYMGAFFIISSYSLSFFLPSSKIEKWIKIVLVAAGVLVFFSLIFRFYTYFPGPIRENFHQVADYLEMISKKTTSIFPDVGQSIKELQTDSPILLAVKVSGHIGTLLLSLAGLVFMFIRKKEVLSFFAPVLVLSVFTFYSRRFLIFFVPIYALGIGYLIAEVVFKNDFFQKISNPLFRYGSFLIVTVAVFAYGFYYCLIVHVTPSVTIGEVALAKAVPQSSSPGGVVWGWWDYGYPLQYFTGKRTFIDGGSQSPRRTFVSSFPLSCHDPVLARNWIRFFGAHDLAGLDKLNAHLGGLDNALPFLKGILSKPEDVENMLLKAGFKDVDQWKEFFFPREDVFIYLTGDMIGKAYWWYYFGTWEPQGGRGTHPGIYKIKMSEMLFDEEKGVIRTNNASVTVGKLLKVNPSGVEKKDLPSAVNKIALFLEHEQIVYVIDEDLFESLVFKLLFEAPLSTSGFKPVQYNPRQGGVWKVE